MKTREKKAKIIAEPRTEAFWPMLLSALCMLISLIISIIDKFIYNISSDMMSPLLAQLIILLIPAYLFILVTMPRGSMLNYTREFGIRGLKAGYIFLTIFTAAFMICVSFILKIIFGGVYATAEGFTLFGTFTAGAKEYTVAYQYLIPLYALGPAIIEEFVFRGILFSSFKKISLPMAYLMTSLISALFVFSVGELPAAFFCSLVYCFILQTTGSLISCVIVHFLFNFYALFAEVNLSQYFLSSNNNTLLLIVVFLALFVSCVLFFGEAARIYRAAAKEVKESQKASAFPSVNTKELKVELKAIFSHRPTLIAAIACLVLYVASVSIVILV